MKLLPAFLLSLALGSLAFADQSPDAAPAPPAPALKLWYRQPGRRWLDSLPLGNGHMSASVYGGVQAERISLTEISLWTGAPAGGQFNPKGGAAALAHIRELMLAGKNDDAWNETMQNLKTGQDNYGTNVPGGDLLLNQQGVDGPATQYCRLLDLDSAVATTSFYSRGVHFTREAFVSHPDRILAVRLGASQPGKIGFSLSYDPGQLPCTVEAKGNDTLIVNGHAYGPHANANSGVAFQIVFHVMARGGTVTGSGKSLSVSGADSAIVLVAFNTNFGGVDPAALNQQQMQTASGKSWENLLVAHVADHQRLFRRVSLHLGAAPADPQPTDVRLATIGAAHPDPDLEALFFQYGRYLLIASSRADSPLPTHLQGIWNDNIAANMGWSCDFHLNINTEQNYWPSETCNLSECGEPLFRLVESLTGPGHAQAKATYGIDQGWVCNWSTNAWGAVPTGEGGWGFEVVGGVWVARSLWDHYLYTGDRVFLEQRAYPVLKGAAEFFLAYLFPDPKTGYLLSGPSGSPERGFNGPSPQHDTALITALFEEVIAGGKILGQDADLGDRLKAALAKLPPYKIGKNGQIQEWLTVDDGGETNHRHTSHLVGLFPLGDISPRGTPDLAKAAAKSISLRMDRPDFEDVEWSRANGICYQARLLNGDSAEASVVDLIHRLCRANLCTISAAGIAGASQDVFAVDGNEAGSAGIAEMLLQSYTGEIELLPALPKDWPDGSVQGLRAQGGFQIDESWHNGKLANCIVRSTRGGPCKVRWGNKVVTLVTKPGGSYRL